MDRERVELSAEEIRTTAELARLLVSDADIERLRSELSAVLSYAAQLDELDVTGVPPMTHAVALSCPLRPDVVGPHDALATALRNAPATAGGLYAVPAIFAPAPPPAVPAGPPNDPGDPADPVDSAGRGAR